MKRLLSSLATLTILTGPDADAVNEDVRSPAVRLLSSDVSLETTFDYEAPALSLTVFRVRD